MKKKKLKKEIKVLLFFVIIILLLGAYLLFKPNEKDSKKDNKQNNTEQKTNNKPDDNNNTKPKNKFEDGKYYLEKNLERYESYATEHSDLDINEIIKRVNSGIDKKWYEDVELTDLSKGNLMIINKLHYVDKNFEPENLVSMAGYGNGSLVKDAHDAYVKMYDAAKQDGMNLYVSTSYRDYNFQSTLYWNYVNEDGQENADTYSARPGYSEHHSGLAVDLGTAANHSITQFRNYPEYNWMKENCYKYGFIQRYTDANQYITGYQPEEWHYRYVGEDVAKYIYENNLTFEEYYAYFVEK